MFALKYAAFVVLAAAAVNADTEVPQIMTGTHTCMDHACMHGNRLLLRGAVRGAVSLR